ncbi:flagellin [bacterium]|nr:flagellin [bacterium]
MRINQNIYALNAQRNLQITNNRLAVSLERLSSGLRINRASDDAAGLAISEKLRAQVSGLGVSIDNANDGISLIRTAEGALDRVNAILKRMRDLVGWAANGDKTDADRQKYQDEINQLIEEINRISTTTEYNTKKLLNGQLGSKVTIDPSDVAEVEYAGVSGNILRAGTYVIEVLTAGVAEVEGLAVLGGSGYTSSLYSALGASADFTKTLTISTADGKSASVTLNIASTGGDTIETAIQKINTALQNAGMVVTATWDDTNDRILLTSQEVGSKYAIAVVQSNSVSGAVNFTISQVTTAVDVTVSVTDPAGGSGQLVTSTSRYFAAGTSTTEPVDSSGIAGVTFTLTSTAAAATGTIVTLDVQKGSLTLQIGPNAGSDHRMEITINDMSANALGVANIDVTNQASAQAIIDAQTIDKAIEKVVTERGKLGAYENRLNHTIQNLGVAKENLTSAESRLRDADLAAEMMEFTRNQIMLQAGTAMLAQANTVPQTVLQLLR